MLYKDRRFVPQDTLQDTKDLPSSCNFKCPEGHSGPFRPIRISEGDWLQCRYNDLQDGSEDGYCDQRFLIKLGGTITVLINADIYNAMDDLFEES